MKEFNLYDGSLYYLNTNIYQNSLVSDRHPKNFSWVSNKHDIESFYTYTEMSNIRDNPVRNLILLESSAIIPNHVYAASLPEYSDKFKHIYTHDSRLLNVLPHKTRWIPGGGVWIGTNWGGGSIEAYCKTKLCSFFNSGKIMCDMHAVRDNFFKICKEQFKKVDLFSSDDGFVKPVSYLEDYMFSVIFENNVDELYFTEKILNCFATGTIPIYIGATKISNIFNIDGIIQCTSIRDVFNAIGSITPELYNSKYDAVIDNLERCIKFTCIEDYMWENYLCN